MYLYELALELDERSADLAARAEVMGLDGAGPATMLTAEQAEALRVGSSTGSWAGPALAWVTGGADLEGPAHGRSPVEADDEPGRTRSKSRWFARSGRR